MFLSEDFFDRWEELISDIEISSIPIECIAKVLLKLEDRKQKTINVKKMLDSGIDYEIVESTVSDIMENYDDIIVAVKFTLDVERVAEMVQPYTDKLLKEL